MKYLTHLLLAGVMIIVSSGCSFRTGDLSVVSSKNVGLQPEVIRRGVEGSDCSHMLLFIPLGSMVPNLDEAMDRALEKVPEGNVLTDLAIYNDVLFTYIYNRTCLRVKGDVGSLK
jgi:hypothetical protein